ncbi:uncharacterized protein SPSK_01776 [Sporothrix schenckii 1099-18]|uniref:Aminoglycoside phosphotransferase domain-containing protein n=1 Tax=Sporothrix schenckii 1099-18 TaxID=1397361 RepID=A0A0F2MD91_SPOSC|nr:uncharacterized protein SPSK_01776 [Sporothrix schenckii 1099-18]KJR87607.1 hypothetical protein SPSK_01776 [Sporothrix schenckii 1099-18]
MAYSDDYQWPYNNFLYQVKLAKPASTSIFPGTQPGTSKAPPEGVSVLVLKLSNLRASGMNNTNRVENDIAVQSLVRQSMVQAKIASLVPAIYAWAPATSTDANADESCYGWTMSELMRGIDLDLEFASLKFTDKVIVLGQIAAAFSAIQAARLPEGVTGFGGLTFNSSGEIVSGEAAFLKSSPQDSYTGWKQAKIMMELQEAAKSSLAQGWKCNGVGARVDQFLSTGGLEKLLSGVDINHRILIHGDLTLNNMLFDKETKKITAILDYDWSFVSNPFDEFNSLLYDIGCNITHPDTAFNKAKLSGDFTKPLDKLDEDSKETWEMAKTWNAAMAKHGVVTPREIKGVEKIHAVLRLQSLICPYPLCSESALEKMDDAQKAELRAKAETDLLRWLNEHGF